MTENSLPKPSLLLVDDMQSNILMLNEFLCEEYQTYFAMDGVTALQMATEQLPDLILLDIQMPQMDGMEVCRRLQENPTTRRIPVIFITALSQVEAETKGLALGAVDYITKPFNAAIVQLRVKNQIVIKKYQDHLEELVRERTAKLQLAKEAAEASDQMKSRFLMILAHELRTPLNHIIGFSDLLSNRLTEENSVEQARCILSSANKLNEIVENILDLVRLENSQVCIAHQPFDIRALVLRSANEIKGKYLEKEEEIELVIEIEDSLWVLGQGDAARIKQVLNHLLDNAFKFTSHGSVRLKVMAGEFNGVSQLIFSVRDTGCGIATDKLEVIFGVFTSGLDNPATQHKGGIGIGLAICQHVVKLMQGRIWVDGCGPDGSEFLFSIPCQDGDV